MKLLADIMPAQARPNYDKCDIWKNKLAKNTASCSDLLTLCFFSIVMFLYRLKYKIKEVASSVTPSDEKSKRRNIL